MTASHVLGQKFHLAIQRVKRERGVPLVVIKEIQPTAISRPLRTLHIPIELWRCHPRIGAIPVHQIKMRRLMSLITIIESDVGDRLSIRRNRRSLIWPLTISKWLHLAVGE